MNQNFTHAEIADLVESQLNAEDLNWIKDALKKTVQEKSARALFLKDSLLGTRFPNPETVKTSPHPNLLEEFIADRKMNTLELSRIYLLSSVLDQEPEFFTPKVTQLIQIADKGELSTFLTYLVLLPNPENFRVSAVEALRTNIATVFDAIALNNPFPALYMTEHEWNQMFLKAAFMQRPLYEIKDIDARANASLARIISDYAHERWAASRAVDPYIWRPAGPFFRSGSGSRYGTASEKR